MYNIIIDEYMDESEKCEKIKALILEDKKVIAKQDFMGRNPLHWAVIHNLVDVSKLLLEAGSPIDATDYALYTPLHFAAESGLEQMILLLSYNHTNPNAVDDAGETALHKAVRNQHVACVKTLLMAIKTDKTIRNSEGQTVEDIARNTRDIKLQSALVKALQYQPDLFGRSPLHLAIIDNLPDLVHKHLKLGAPVNKKDRDGRTALHLAAECGYAPILLLLSYHPEIDMDKIDNNGNTALHNAIQTGHADCVKILVSANKPVNKTIKNHKGLLASDLIEKINDPEIRNSMTKTFSSMQISNGLSEDYKREIFNLEKPYNSSIVFYVQENLKALALKSRGSVADSGNYHPQAIHISHDKKKRPSIEGAFSGNDTKLFVKILREYVKKKAAKHVIFSLEKIKRVQTEAGYNFLFKVKDMLLVDVKKEKESFSNDLRATEQGFQQKLLLEGLKKICGKTEMNHLPLDEFSSMLSRKGKDRWIFQTLFAICSGEHANNTNESIIIDLKAVTQKTLGLFDYLEPQEILRALIKLNPLFSKMQKLLSHFIIYTLLQNSMVFGYDLSEEKFLNGLEGYRDSNKKIAKDLLGLSDDLLGISTKMIRFNSNSMHAIYLKLNQISSEFVFQSKESIFEKLDKIASQSPVDFKRNKFLSSYPAYFARELSNLTAVFHQQCPLKEFKGIHWEDDDHRMASLHIISHNNKFEKLTNILQTKILHFHTPQQRANVITLLILAARDCLHYSHGPDLNSVMAITLALQSSVIIRLTSTFELIDKKIKKMLEALTQIINPNNNFKYYRDLCEQDHRALPFLGIMRADKIHIHENKNRVDNLSYLGNLYQSLIFLKKNLQYTLLYNRSDLHYQLAQHSLVNIKDLERLSYIAELSIPDISSHHSPIAFSRYIELLVTYSLPLEIKSDRSTYRGADAINPISSWLKSSDLDASSKKDIMKDCLAVLRIVHNCSVTLADFQIEPTLASEEVRPSGASLKRTFTVKRSYAKLSLFSVPPSDEGSSLDTTSTHKSEAVYSMDKGSS